MHRLNFHHLLLFTTLVREGSLVGAGRALRLSHSTLSAQIRGFEEHLGTKLVEKQGRRLVPTDAGRMVVRYGEQIFGLGHDLLEAVHGRPAATSRLRIGIVDAVPKAMVRRLLEPLLSSDPAIHLVCSQPTHHKALSQLELHELDVVLSDTPPEAGAAVRAYNHLLGTCEVSFFGAAPYAKLKGGFPGSLTDAPMLLPLDGSPLRRALNVWFAAHDIHPHVVAELEDCTLLRAIAQEGAGVFAAPAAVERETCRQYGVKVLGRRSEELV